MPPRRRPPGGLYAMGRGYAEEDGSGRGRSGKHTIVVWSARGLDVIPLSLWLLYFSCVYAERGGAKVWIGASAVGFQRGERLGFGSGLLFMPRRR